MFATKKEVFCYLFMWNKSKSKIKNNNKSTKKVEIEPLYKCFIFSNSLRC